MQYVLLKQLYPSHSKFGLVWSLKLRENSGRKNTSCVLSDALNLRPQVRSQNQFKYFSENNFFLKNYITSEGAVSHHVLYYQQLSVAC